MRAVVAKAGCTVEIRLKEKQRPDEFCFIAAGRLHNCDTTKIKQKDKYFNACSVICK